VPGSQLMHSGADPSVEDRREAQRFAEDLERSFETEPMLLELELQLARELMEAQAEGLRAGTPVTVEDRRIGMGDHGCSARIFRPETIVGVYLHVHGGGWCLGSSRTQDARLGSLAVGSELAVVSVDYRLAPEHPFPAAVDDCVTALRWVLGCVGAEFGSDVLLVGGESAGAHLVALSLIRLRDQELAIERVRGVNLSFGVFDLGLTPSQRLMGAARVGLTTPLLERCYSRLLPGRAREDRRSPEVSPLYAELNDLPPALFTVGQRDLLLDDTLFMFARWKTAGNEAKLSVYPEALHGFLTHPIAIARLATQEIQQWLRERALANLPQAHGLGCTS
jgi:acetyl esterase